jgi:endoglucanase
MKTHRRPYIAVLGAIAIVASGASTAGGASSSPRLKAELRVDQVGYLVQGAKHAYLMTSAKVSGETFDVVDSAGRARAHGKVSAASRGRWNAAFPAVYDITFSGLTRPGRYHVVVHGAATARSLSFPIEDATAMYRKLIIDGTKFDQVQRDGEHVVPGPLHRKPAHLKDHSAAVYAWPHFQPDSDTITDTNLTRIGGPVDVAGGWADAGDYLKFTHTSAYNDVVLYASDRDLGRAAAASLDAEARHGSEWLSKMWDERSKTLYLQVGIGSGNQQGTFFGDHDGWRLPQADDHDAAVKDRYVAHRPVFEATAPGSKISPNLVGRVSAAFALAAQVDASHHHSARARREYAEATSLYAMADTATPPNPLTTALPNAFYPEDTWHDDMELGATEIALAAQRLHRSAGRYLHDAARWAKAYIAHDTGDTFNLYDTSALAHVDLSRAIDRAGDPAALAVSRAALISDLRRQLHAAGKRAPADPFRAAGNYDDFDVDSHTLGLVATAGWYRTLTGDRGFDAFAAEQRDWVFGANPWGVSFMVGEGTVFPHCMQHQVANLSGTTDGRPPLDVGAVVNGPNGKDVFDAGGLGDYQDGMVKCPANGRDSFAPFNGRGSRYVDDVRAWETDEPALDMTAAAIAAASANLVS